MTYTEHSGILAVLVHGNAVHEGSSWVCAWELGIYKGKDKRATNVIKEPGAVDLKVSMLPVRESSDDDGGKDQRRLVKEETIYCAMRIGFSSPYSR